MKTFFLLLAGLIAFATASFAQNVTVTGSTGADGSYATLKDAFDTLNANTTQTGNTIAVSIVGDTTEVGSASLSQPSGGSWTSLTISPSGGVTRTISGNLALPLVILNGADNVTIDGLNTGGNGLTISNASTAVTAGTSTIKFIGDATSNTVTNCSVLGSALVAVAADGGNIWFSTGTTTGNDNNTISNCNIGPVGASLPIKLIYGLGTTATAAQNNSGVVINNNNLFDFFNATAASRAVDIQGGNTDWTISNNKIFQTVTRTWTTGAEMRGISINNSTSANNMQVTGNTIGFANAGGTGTFTITGGANLFKAIHLVVAATTASNIQNNTVANISQTTTLNATTTSSACILIYPQTGLITTTGNTIGSLTGTGSISYSSSSTSTGDVLGIFNFSSNNALINNNNIGSITVTDTSTGSIVLHVIKSDLISTVTATVSGNTIGGTTANSINNTATATSSRVVGWLHSTGISSFTGNTIRNLTMSAGNTGTAATASVVGIQENVATNTTISQNTVFNLSNTNATLNVSVVGALFLGGTSNNVSKNLIYDLSVASSGTGTSVDGLIIGSSSSGATVNVFNNMIGNLTAPAAANGTATSSSIRGIAITSTATTTNINLSFNTVYLNASSTGANFGTTGLFHTFNTTATTAALVSRNNVIVNTSTPAGTGLTVAFRRTAATNLNNYGNASNNNDLYAGTPGASRLIFHDGTNADQTMSAFKTRVSPRDSASFSENPPFLSTTSGTANFLHIDPTIATQLESGGIPIAGITDDFDGNTRNATTPDVGADEFSGILLDLNPPNIVYTPLANTGSTTARTLTATITDASGVPTAGAGLPVLYWKINAGSYTAATGTFIGSNQYQFTFGSGVVATDVVSYYIVAQDNAGNVGAFPSAGASGFTTNPPAAATPPTTPSSYTILALISGSKNVGTGGDYTTLTAAIADLNAKELNGALTLTLTDATYPTETFPIVINANSGSSATNTVLIKVATGVSPVITGSSAVAIIKINGASYVTIDGSNSGAAITATRDLSIINTNTGTSSAVIWLATALPTTGASNNTVKNCVVTGNAPTTTLAGILSSGSVIGAVAEAANNNNTYQNNAVTKAFFGIGTVGPNGNETGTVITGNLVGSAVAANKIGGNGIAVFQQASATVSNNRVLGVVTSSSNTTSGIRVAGTANGISIDRNQISDVKNTSTSGFGSNGIHLQATVTTANVTISNNFIWDVSAFGFAGVGSADNGWGIMVDTGAGFKIYDNSVFMGTNQTAAGSITAAINISSAVTTAGGVDLRGNIFDNAETVGTRYAIYDASNAAVFSTINNNDYFAQNVGFLTSARATLANWQTATGQDAASKSVDPLFVSTTDLHLQATSTLLGMGVSVAGVTTDIDGQTRPATPDIGADEILTPGVLQFSVATNLVAESVGSLVMNVTRTGGSDGSVSVVYNPADGSALSPSDYTCPSGNLIWADGDTANKTITATIVDDNVDEPSQDFTVTLSAATGGATIGTNVTATNTITDNDSPPTFSIDNVTQAEGSAGPNDFTFTVTKTGATEFVTSIDYFTQDGSAVAPGDYTAIPQTTLTFQPSDTTKQVMVSVNGDTTYENTEAFTVQLTNQMRGGFAVNTPNGTPFVGTGTIQNDDTAPTFAINDVTMNEGDAGVTNFVFTVTKTGSTALNSSVTFQTNDGSATLADNDYSSNSGPLNFGPADTMMQITVAVNGDTAFEPTENFTVDLSGATGATISDGSGLGTITNDDPSNNANLSNLTASAGPLSPPFDANTLSYTVNAPNSTTSTTVTPTAADAGATITVNGNPVASGSPSGSIPLNVGNNNISVVVTAQDTTTMKTYTINVIRAPSSNADLSNLVLSDGTLNPAFASGTTSYTASVPNATSSMTVTPTAADANATIQVRVNGGGYATVASGSPSGSLALNVGSNTIDVKVAAQDEMRPGHVQAPATLKVYTVTVTRAGNSNADLSDLTATAGPLSPAFAPATTSYTVNTPFSTTSTTVTPTAADAGATITVNAVPVTSGSPSGSIALSVGNNIITVVVTAADTTTMKTYTINVIRAGNVTVSGSTGADGMYGTLKDAFTAINANGTQGGNTISVTIIGDTAETASAVLNQPSVSSWTSLTVTPSGARTVSGSLAAPLVDLNGADNVIINGFNSAGNSLTISNASTASTAGTSTIRFIEGATNDTVQNCTILGSSTASTATAGGNVLFSTSTVAGGNSTNTVSNNDIGPAGANLPTKGIMGLGTAANLNSGNIINNNNVFDYFNATTSVSGINVQANNTTWTISNNRIYQTASRAFTGAGLRYAGITLNNTGSFSITGNTIGFASAAGTGTTTISGSTNTLRGIDAASASTTVATSIQGNTISGISQTTASTGTGTTTGFIGIMLGSTDGLFNVGNSTGNNIGSLTGASTISVTSSAGTGIVYGIFNFSFVGTNISNNNIGSISIGGTATANGFRGILVNTSSAAAALATVNGNTISDISDTQVGNYAMYGIQIALPPTSMTGNTVRNFTGNANGAVVVMGGLAISNGTSTIPSTISQNTVHSLNNTVTGGAAGALYVIDLTLPTQANIVERNFAHSCKVTTTFTTYQLFGIIMRGTTATFKNNMVRLGIDSTGASITTPYSIIGLRDAAATGASSSYYYNSVYIGGSGVLAGGSNTFALNSNVVTLAHTYVDNIFHNARSNAVGGGTAHVAIAVAGTAPNPAGLTSNYNDLFASGTDGVVGVFNATIQPTLAAWRTATGQDANSISANPSFVNPTGTAATVDLHIDCNSPADGAATPVAGITTDFDNETRHATTPDIGADEINLGNPPALVSAVSRKMHGALGPFDITLPGVECRSGGATNAYQMVFTFNTPVTTSGAIVTSGTGVVSLVSAVGNTIVVDLTGVTNAQYLTVKLLCVYDNVNLGSVSAKMGVLIGDVTANTMVNASDVNQVKADVGNVVDGTNFFDDVTASGDINASDVNLTKIKSGTALPP